MMLSELNFSGYKAVIKVNYDPDSGVSAIAELLRSISSVTVVRTKKHNQKRNIALFDIRIITIEDPIKAYEKVRSIALAKIPELKTFTIGTKTITRV